MSRRHGQNGAVGDPGTPIHIQAKDVDVAGVADQRRFVLNVPPPLVAKLRANAAAMDALQAQQRAYVESIFAVNDVPWDEFHDWQMVEDFTLVAVTGPATA